MRVGVIVRVDDRGLGMQTQDVARALAPCEVLVVMPTPDKAQHYVQRPELYPGAPAVMWDGEYFDDLRLVGKWLRKVDVIYSAETFYDDRLLALADAMGVATVQHVNPEFFRPERPPATQVWLPTPWRQEHFPGSVVMPMPVAIEEAHPAAEASETVEVLHVVGRRATGDRNGTSQVLAALKWMQGPSTLRVTTQDNRLPAPTRIPHGVHYRPEMRNVANRWDLYRGAHVLVMPRRFGGLCLPVLEAMASGCAVVMTDTSPNETWPTIRCSVHDEQPIELETMAGPIRLVSANPRSLAHEINRLVTEPAWLAENRVASVQWAEQNTWDRLRSTWVDGLADAIEKCRAEL